ncbi:hypothetical protein [Kitasatospora sp. NPDC054795]
MTGMLLGLLSAAVALALATAALHRPAADRHVAARAVRALRRLHSGHVGDYLAWLALGVAALCVATAAQT